MNVKKKVLAAVGALTMFWSVAAHAEPNMYTAYNLVWDAMAEIHNECSLYWTYDPDPYSNYGGCVASGKLSWANTYYIASSLVNPEALDGEGYNISETLDAAGDALYYGF